MRKIWPLSLCFFISIASSASMKAACWAPLLPAEAFVTIQHVPGSRRQERVSTVTTIGTVRARDTVETLLEVASGGLIRIKDDNIVSVESKGSKTEYFRSVLSKMAAGQGLVMTYTVTDGSLARIPMSGNFISFDNDILVFESISGKRESLSLSQLQTFQALSAEENAIGEKPGLAYLIERARNPSAQALLNDRETYQAAREHTLGKAFLFTLKSRYPGDPMIHTRNAIIARVHPNALELTYGVGASQMDLDFSDIASYSRSTIF